MLVTGALAAQPAELLTNARVLLFDGRGMVASSLLIANGRIAAIDDSALALRMGATVVDLGGATVMPAFTDHHVHLLNVGLWLLNDVEHERLFVDLSRVTSLDDVVRRLHERARATPRGGWVLGAGWSQASWGTQALPGAADLDRARLDHPVFLARADGHAGWVNSAALRRAHVAIDIEGSAPGRARVAGHHAGILLERANEPLVASLPLLADADVRSAYRMAANALAARGVTEAYDAGALGFPGVAVLNADFGRFLRLLRAEDAAAPLPLRVKLMIPAPSALAESLLASSHDWRLSPRLSVTHLKLFADGALGSRGAALTHPYADDASTRGVARMTTREITTLALRALDAGLGVATHAIGDEAVKRALDAYDAVLVARPLVVRTRLRIEHFSYAREQDLLRAAKMGVVLSIQSNFNSAMDDDPSFGAMRVGAANEPRVYAWDRLERMGAQLAEGSDYFARPLEPLAGFVAALTRRNAVGQGRPDSIARALVLAMQVARRASDGTRVDPQLRVGMPADLVVLSDDPSHARVEALAKVTVLRTYSAGRLVHESKP